MRFLLFFTFLVLSSAQLAKIDDEDVKNKELATQWLNSIFGDPSQANLTGGENINDKETVKSSVNIIFADLVKPNITDTSDTCKTSDETDGKCVEPWMCRPDTTTLFDLRASSECSKSQVCCALNLIYEKPKTTEKKPMDKCGWTNPGAFSFYSSRDSDRPDPGFAEFGEFPWMVAVLKKSQNQVWSDEDYIGGGTLIHPSVILTVAHKVYRKKSSELKCRAGEWNTQSVEEVYPHQDRDVSKVVNHELFNSDEAHYDAALLFLATPFDLKDAYHIGVACLARDMPAHGTLCYSMGWGTSFDNSKNAIKLKKVQLPIVDPEICQSQLRKTELGFQYKLHNSLTCAGGVLGEDTCVGDGGSPLVCLMEKDTYLVHGMVVYALEPCGRKDVPGVYAKVPVMLDWIKRVIEAEGLSSSTYLNYDMPKKIIPFN